MSHSDLASSTCQHPATDTLTQSNKPTRCFCCGWVKQHLALILPKAVNALSGKYQFFAYYDLLALLYILGAEGL